MTLEAPTQRTNSDSFRELVIARPNGRIIRLGDVANVRDSVENLNQGSWLDGNQGITMAVFRQPGANTVEVVRSIRAKLPELEAALPANMHVSVVNDSAQAISDAVAEVEMTLVLTVGLVVLVIFLFFRRLIDDPHSRPGRSDVARRHVRRDVSARLFHR